MTKILPAVQPEHTTLSPPVSSRLQTHTRPHPPLDVLLLDGQQRQALASARIYGKRGLKVGVAVCAAEAANAPVFRSRWSQFQTILPDVEADSDGFVDVLLQTLAEQPARMVLPGHDGTIEALRTRREEIERLAFLPLAPEAALDIAVSKERTMTLARELGIPTPQGIVVRSDAEFEAAVRDIRPPFVVKPIRSWVRQGDGGTRLISTMARSVDEARRGWGYISRCGGEAEIQPWLPGRREAVSYFLAKDEIWGQFAQISYREFPALGGVSVLCESIPVPEDTGRYAERLVRAIGLEGCSMVEFRRDAAGRPVLMEINPRMGGSVALATRCGVDFPGLVYAWASGCPLEKTETYATGKRLRWLSGDFWNLKVAFDTHAQGHPDVPGRAAAVTRFLLDFVARPAMYDPFDITDLRPAWRDVRTYILGPMGNRVRRKFGKPGRLTEER